MHHGEHQVAAPGRVRARPTRLQEPGRQLKRALLVPLRLLSLLHQAGGVLLLADLDDSVNIAAALLALRPQTPCAKDGHVDMRRDPSLIIVVQAYKRHPSAVGDAVVWDNLTEGHLRIG